jgi:hypothetical protein
MKSILTKIQILSFLCALPALANDVGLHKGSAQPTRADTEPLYGSMGGCVVSPTLAKMGIGANSSLTNGLSLYPQGTALRRLPEASDDVTLQMAAKHASVQILQQPKHGGIVSKDGDFNYVPNQGYVGNDNVVFLVNIDGRIVKTVYYINVVDAELNSRSFDSLYKKYCPVETDWLISASTTDANSLVSTLTQSWVNLAQSNITFSIADLPGVAVARVGWAEQKMAEAVEQFNGYGTWKQE